MAARTGGQLPIGYWLKHTDEMLTRRINETLGQYGLTRFHWQVLNSVQETANVSQAQLLGFMQTFIDEGELDRIISEFVQRGWMVRHEQAAGGAAQLELTSEGQEAHRTILSVQSEVRKQAVQGITEEEYTTVIRVLQKMVSNLEND